MTRATSDFRLFAPFLQETLDLQRAYADAIGYGEHTYDALLDLYEPGETRASVLALFDELRPALRHLLGRGALARRGRSMPSTPP